MTLTRANMESMLVKRCGGLMTAAGLAVTVAGSNADLNDPIGYAIRKCGGTTASFVSVADGDIASIAEANYDKLLAIAELRTLYNIRGNYDDVDISIGSRSESFSQLMKQLEEHIARVESTLKLDFGIGIGSISAQVIQLDFAEHNETMADTE